jgi:hypothetical protein
MRWLGPILFLCFVFVFSVPPISEATRHELIDIAKNEIGRSGEVEGDSGIRVRAVNDICIVSGDMEDGMVIGEGGGHAGDSHIGIVILIDGLLGQEAGRKEEGIVGVVRGKLLILPRDSDKTTMCHTHELQAHRR